MFTRNQCFNSRYTIISLSQLITLSNMGQTILEKGVTLGNLRITVTDCQ